MIDLMWSMSFTWDFQTNTINLSMQYAPPSILIFKSFQMFSWIIHVSKQKTHEKKGRPLSKNYYYSRLMRHQQNQTYLRVLLYVD
uniref:Uncharacterized protein n=1 Tax=Arundo donax TaxID=35708 RepID=A0A0A9D6R2_ARUDO